jgi:hypothetical protein
MSQIKKITVYYINELSDKARDHAHNDYLSEGDYYFWDSENRNSLDKFAEIFNLKIKSACYGARSEGVNWSPEFYDYQDEILNLSGIRLLRWLYNNVIPQITKPKYIHYGYRKNTLYPNKAARYSKCQFTIDDCPLTGYCMDICILDPVYKFIKNPVPNTSLNDLIEDCFSSWVKGCNDDLEYSASMEAFIESCNANEWTFTESGKMENI